MKIYGHPGSTCTQKVLITLAEKGLDAELVLVDFAKGEQKSPAHVKRQPFGVIPALEDGDFMLYESRAIIRYLDAKFDKPRLTPTELRDRARMDQWMSVEPSYFSPSVMSLVVQKLYMPMRGQKPNAEIVEQGEKGSARVLDVLDRALDGQQYLAGSQFTLADVCFMPYLGYLFAARATELVTSRKNVASWWGRLSERSSWRKVHQHGAL
jgi:glutathione S-transferase